VLYKGVNVILNPEAKLARTIGEALLAYAEEKTRQGTAVAQPEPLVEDAAVPTPRGPRQKDIAEVLVAAPLEGFKTGDIARMVSMDQPNAYLTLQALAKQGVAELVPGSDPQRWRLLARYRQRRSIFRAAAQVRRGEFTSYGDISQVVYGHGQGGQAVGRVASKDKEFPNPHRVLAKGGLIPAEWALPDGTGGPDAAEELLKKEGVKILRDDDGHRYAHPRHYVSFEELNARLRDASAA
jgi:alkylated DNA nucleotide flippase Atl1